MNELLLRRPLAAWGEPATMSVTSPRDLPQNEQRTPRAFILAIISVTVAQLARCVFFKARKLTTCVTRIALPTRGAQSPRLLNHIPWLDRDPNIDRARRPVRFDRGSGQCVWQKFARSARGCESVPQRESVHPWLDPASRRRADESESVNSAGRIACLSLRP